MNLTKLPTLLLAMSLFSACQAPTSTEQKAAQPTKQGVLPFHIPAEKPDYQLSAAMNRYYDQFDGKQPHHNELFSQFRYTELEGFDYSNYDGTITRRDPSRILLHDGKYYMWYTYRNTSTPPRGAKGCSETIPSADWDLAEIWYATSTDGFKWEEQGVAVPRPPKPELGHRAVTTTEILEWKGKFYLYFQAFNVASGTRGDDCPVSVAVADSPDGPWKHSGKVVVPNGAEGEWDQYSIHDPHPLVHDGKIYLYYKSDFDAKPLVRMQGLAIADDPLGPFVKHPLNPIINSGHETGIFPFKKGVAALVYKDGPEHNTIQYAEDWVNFEIVSITELMPYAASFFMPDASLDNGDGRGVTWGMAHFLNCNRKEKGRLCSKLVRFDCDLSLDVHDPAMKEPRVDYAPEVYYQHGLSPQQKERIAAENAKLTKATAAK